MDRAKWEVTQTVKLCECAGRRRKTIAIWINNVFIIQISICLCSFTFHWSRQETFTMWKSVLSITGNILFPLIQDIWSQELCVFTFHWCYFIKTECQCNMCIQSTVIWCQFLTPPPWIIYFIILLSTALKFVEFSAWAARTKHSSHDLWAFRKNSIKFSINYGFINDYFMESETSWISIFRKHNLLSLHLQIQIITT